MDLHVGTAEPDSEISHSDFNATEALLLCKPGPYAGGLGGWNNPPPPRSTKSYILISKLSRYIQ